MDVTAVKASSQGVKVPLLGAHLDAKLELKALVERAGFTVWTKLEHTSHSGMMRYIDCFVILNNEPLRISHLMAQAAPDRFTRASMRSGHDGLKVEGCGMDMGFAVVFSLGQFLYGTSHDQAITLKQRWL